MHKRYFIGILVAFVMMVSSPLLANLDVGANSAKASVHYEQAVITGTAITLVKSFAEMPSIVAGESNSIKLKQDIYESTDTGIGQFLEILTLKESFASLPVEVGWRVSYNF